MRRGMFCQSCFVRAVGYVVAISRLDRELWAVADLCGAAHSEPLAAETANNLGVWIASNLRRRRRLGHCYFGELVPWEEHE